MVPSADTGTVGSNNGLSTVSHVRFREQPVDVVPDVVTAHFQTLRDVEIDQSPRDQLRISYLSLRQQVDPAPPISSSAVTKAG